MSADRPLTSEEFDEVGLDEWRRSVVERLGDRPIESLERRTSGGIEVRPLYVEGDLAHVSSLPEREAAPGGGWTVCAVCDQDGPVEAAAALSLCSMSGAEAHWIAFDRVARLGLEVDTDGAGDHLGRGGAMLHHGSDLGVLLGAVELGGGNLGGRQLWLDAGGNALPATVALVAALRGGDGQPDGVVLCSGADPLGALARDGRLPRDLMKLESEMGVLARFSAGRPGGGRAIVVSTEAYHAAGSTVAQELAFAVATLTTYLRALQESGLSSAEGASQIALRFALGPDLFVEIAKLRAARMLWTMVLRSLGVANPPAAWVHAVGSRRTATRRNPGNNALRSTGQTFAAACGGADMVTLHGYDLAYGASGDAARRLAQTTQVVLAEEALLGRVSDPAAGSYYVESLTRDLARAGWEEAQTIERQGGMRDRLLAGRVGDEVAASAEARRMALEDERAAITGVTAYVFEGEEPIERPVADERERLDGALERLRAHRAQAGAAAASEVAYSRNFVVDQLVAEADAGATLAELSARLGSSEGAERIEPLPLRRDAEPYEQGFGSEVPG